MYMLCAISSITADPITLTNATFRDLYAAMYYQSVAIPLVSQASIQIATDVSYIAAKTSAAIDCPAWKASANRQLIFVEDPIALSATLTQAQFNTYNSKNIGVLQGSSFYIGDNNGDLSCYNSFEWNAIEIPLAYAEQEILNLVPLIDNPYQNTIATVRQSNDLCDQEKAFLSVRFPHITAGMQAFTGKAPDSIPNISIICSGGGYRAMLYTAGALMAAQNMGLLDCTTYVVGLSGSTWALATWISSGKSIQAFHDWVIQNISFDMSTIDKNDLELIGDVLLAKYFAGQPIGFVDIYGASIANDLFDFISNQKIDVHLSDQSTYIENGTMPFPIYTTISGDTNTELLWYEVSPYEFGAPWLDAYVPTWAFGRKFQNGASLTNTAEQPMSTLLGTFGLAVGVTLQELLQDTTITQSIKLALIQNLITQIAAESGNARAITAEYFNFAQGIQGPLSDLPILHFVDPGISFNLPYPPISGQRAARKADIIICLDASAGIVGDELRKVEAYARANNLHFPAINYTDIDKHAVSVFKDADPQIPVVIYIPRIVDHALLDAHQNDLPELYSYLNGFDVEQCISSGPCDTFNFSYTPEQARCVTALGEFNMLMAQEVVTQLLS